MASYLTRKGLNDYLEAINSGFAPIFEPYGIKIVRAVNKTKVNEETGEPENDNVIHFAVNWNNLGTLNAEELADFIKTLSLAYMEISQCEYDGMLLFPDIKFVESKKED